MDDAFAEKLVTEHRAQVFRLAYRLTGDRDDAEDLTQEVFMRAFAARERFTAGNFAGWLHRITTNAFLDRVRRASVVRMDPLADDAERWPAPGPTPENIVHSAGLDDDIEGALAALPARFRVAVILSDLEGLSHAEVAVALGVKTGTVRSRLHRGRRMLREALAHREPAAGRTRVLGPLVPA